MTLANCSTETLPLQLIRGGSARGGAKVNGEATDQRQMLRDALDLLQIALDLLDRAAAPAQIGAHVDLAANQLSEIVRASAGQPKISAPEQSLARH